jgi:hypothetical protein
MTDSQPSGRSQAVLVPRHLIEPLEPFEPLFRQRVIEGSVRLALSKVAIVGLARNCAAPLKANLERVKTLGEKCRAWRFHCETNDNTDATTEVLAEFCSRHPQASYRDRTLERPQFSAEFAGPRTQALAEYRTACQEWVRHHSADADLVVVIDFDMWGGWIPSGLHAGVGCLQAMPEAYGMASISLIEHPGYVLEQGVPKSVPAWIHYDCWAMRGVGQRGNFFDDYTAGQGGWKHQYLPPVGSPPVLVSSAFGGMGIYRTEAYLAGKYDGSDCEHVPFHQSVAEATGQGLYVCPSMRTIMHWLPSEAGDGGQHDND